MTIDEAIKREKDIIENKKIYAEKHCVTQEFYADIEYLEQLAEWLEELKAIRRWKADVMEGFCKYDASSFEEIVAYARAKSIDDFAEMLKEKYEEHKFDLCLRQNDYYSYSNSCMLFESYIDDIAKQLKAGDNNGT